MLVTDRCTISKGPDAQQVRDPVSPGESWGSWSVFSILCTDQNLSCAHSLSSGGLASGTGRSFYSCVTLWASQETPLGLSLPICKVGTLIVTPDRVDVTLKGECIWRAEHSADLCLVLNKCSLSLSLLKPDWVISSGFGIQHRAHSRCSVIIIPSLIANGWHLLNVF